MIKKIKKLANETKHFVFLQENFAFKMIVKNVCTLEGCPSNLSILGLDGLVCLFS